MTRNTKHKIREYYGLDNKELKNLLHTSDDSVEFYLQYLLCKELHDLDLDKKGYANLFITDANCMYMRNYEKKALIKQNIYQLDKFNDDYNFYGFVSQIEEKGNKKASIINYIISEEDLIKNHSFKIINFFHDLLDKQKLLMYNQIGVRGVLLNCENTDIKDAEIIFEMIEECEELKSALLDIARNMALAQLQEFELKTDGGNCPDNLEREIESLKKSKAHYAQLKFEIYDDYTKANITRDQMAKKTAEVKQKIAEIESLITQKQETLDMQKDLFLDAKQEQLTKLSKLDEFDEEVIRYLIDYVLVYDNEHIEIRWNFDDFQAG